MPMQLTCPHKRNYRPILFVLFACIIGCGAMVIGLARLLPVVQAMREARQREQCAQNLKQIRLAMHRYHQAYGCFPPTFICDSSGKLKHSWRVLILPFMSERRLYSKYRFDEPWNGPHNKALAERMPSVYRCPSDWTSDGSQTSYAMIVGPRAISDGPTPHRMSDVKDGLSNTIMVAEVAGAGITWTEPRDLDTEKMVFRTSTATEDLQRDACEISSCHNVAANVLFCDGAVQALSSDLLCSKELEALITIDGGETVPAENSATARSTSMR